MTRKELPAFITLIACAFTALYIYYKGYGLKAMTLSLLVVFLIFYFIGSIIKIILDSFYAENKKRKEEEGEVIEKEPSAEGDVTKDDGVLIEKTDETK